MVSRLLIPKSSAKHLATRVFSQKGFDISIFGHHRCPFSENFLTLVQIRIEKITKLFYVIMCEKEEHNGLMFLRRKKLGFLGRNILTCDTPSIRNLHILVLFDKTKNMQSSKK